MRTTSILLIAALALSGVAVGCGANEVDMGEGGANPTPTPSGTGTVTPTPTPSATPSAAMFDPVQAFLEIGGTPNRANCGQAACHVPPTGGTAPFPLYTAAATAQVDKDKNRAVMACVDNTDAFDPPAGRLYDTFCTPAGTVLAATQHAGRTNLVNADCAALKAWLETGSGTPPACP